MKIRPSAKRPTVGTSAGPTLVVEPIASTTLCRTPDDSSADRFASPDPPEFGSLGPGALRAASAGAAAAPDPLVGESCFCFFAVCCATATGPCSSTRGAGWTVLGSGLGGADAAGGDADAVGADADGGAGGSYAIELTGSCASLSAAWNV